MPYDLAADLMTTFAAALREGGFRGEVEQDTALLAAMSTDNSVYQIFPELIVAPQDAEDVVRLMTVLAQPAFRSIPLTGRGGGTGTNGQSLNRGVIVDMRRHMTRLLQVNVAEGWAEVEPGIVLDQLNEALRPSGLFFAPETSTSTRCTIGGMVSTDASGKGSRIYGKTSDNILGLQIALSGGLLTSGEPAPDWAHGLLAEAEAAARGGRAAFIAATPKINRRFTGYDLERACPEAGGFDWFRLFLGAEGTLGLITRVRVSLRRIEAEKRLIVAGFDSFRNALVAAAPLLASEPTAIEVMDELVAEMAAGAGILGRLPPGLRPEPGARVGYLFIEFNGDDPDLLARRVGACLQQLATLQGAGQVHVARDISEIRELWAIRSAGVGLLGKIDGTARPVAFVEDCVVPPENLPAFVDDFLAVLSRNGLGFGIYGHVDVGCLHIRPALDIDSETDRARLAAVSDAVFELTRKYGGIFWGEHGKGVRGAYLEDWIGPEAYAALQAVKAAFDPEGRFNPGKLVSSRSDIMGITTTPFRPFNAAEGDPLQKAFRCNGNAQCLSYAAATPMCPSFKATGDVRHSPKGRADALRAWSRARQSGTTSPVAEADIVRIMDSCLGCKACASSCPVQVDIPAMRAVFLEDYYARHRRPLADRLTIMAEALSPHLLRLAPLWRPFWPLLRRIGERVLAADDLPNRIAPPLPCALRLTEADLAGDLAPGTVILVQDWFTALFDAEVQQDMIAGLQALGYQPRFLAMLPAGKAAQSLGARKASRRMAERLAQHLRKAAQRAPLVGADPAFVMMLRQDYAKDSIHLPEVLLPQEFLSREIATGRAMPQARAGAVVPNLLGHCTETTGQPQATQQWAEVFSALGLAVRTPAVGCCGMAGLYGHQKRHQPVSRKLFDLSWRKPVQEDVPVLASGFSCRCQSERLTDKAVRHPLGWLAAQIGQ